MIGIHAVFRAQREHDQYEHPRTLNPGDIHDLDFRDEADAYGLPALSAGAPAG